MFLCSLPDNQNNIVLAISNASKRAIKFVDVINTVLNDKLIKKSFGDYDTPSNDVSNNVLSLDGGKRRERGRNRAEDDQRKENGQSQWKNLKEK